jgi:hypothetical protein
MRLLHRADHLMLPAADAPPPDDYLVVHRRRDFTWRRLLEASAFALIGVLAFVSLVVLRNLRPVGALFAILLVTAVVLLRLPNRYGVHAVAAAALLYGGWTVYRGGLVSLGHPTSAAEFWHAVTTVVLVATIVAAAAGDRRPQRDSRSPTWVALTAVVAIVVAAVVGVGSSLAFDDAVRATDDVSVRIERFEWAPKALSAEAGEVSVFVDNRDAARHVFAIPALGVSLDLPGNHAARVKFSAAPGPYRFECTVKGHEHHGIRGTLFVQ